MRELNDLRYEPTEKRIRGMLGDDAVADSTRALLVWEPRRVVPSYAIPAEDLRAELRPGGADAAAAAPAPDAILHPGIPFGVRATDGESFDVRSGTRTLPGAAFRPADPDLAGYMLLDFNAFDAWYEEDERLASHPRDPFHRVDIHRSSRHVRVELDGEVLAESTQPTLLFETNIPVRFYLPRSDVRVDLRPSTRRSYCPYKGEASYWSADGVGEDIAWSYEDPLPESAAIAGLVSFYDEKADVTLDGETRGRPRIGSA
jgi:uncharacterized protein (DUF427 family)